MTRPRRPTLVVFARAPRLGTVKRRLARGVGDLAALRLYRALLGGLLARVGGDRRWRTVLRATPDRAAAGARGTRWPGPAAARGRFEVAPQGRGDLGARLDRAARAARGPVVVVGSDVPGLAAADVAAAFRALRGGASAVFGPAEDGGYWLVGLPPRGLRRAARPFAGVRWSTEHALADTLANLPPAPRGRVALLRRLRDLDTADDLAALQAAGLLR